MTTWSVAADDRTGALEVGGLVAATLGPTAVSVGALPLVSGVVDLGTRALSSDRAAEVAERFDAHAGDHRFHKIDSTLRGNWVVELRARLRGGRRLVVLPAWPEMGRTCVGGVVHVHGRALADVRDHMPELAMMSDAHAVRRWLASDDTTAIACDIATTDAMLDVARALVDSGCLVAGPAGPIAATLVAQFGERAPAAFVAMPTTGPVVVVCGSANPVALEQVARLRASLADASREVHVVTTPPVDGELSIAATQHLAVEARALIDVHAPAAAVVIGGDTAAALLGDGPRLALGMAAPGMPASVRDDGNSTGAANPLVVTKAGGFGDPDALVRLLARATGENG